MPELTPLEKQLYTNENNWIFINPDSYVSDEVNKVLNEIILKYSKALKLDENLSFLSYGEKINTKKYFENVVDQPVFATDDHKRIRNFIIDWYSSNKTFLTKCKDIKELELLSTEEINEFILSFGYPYPENIINKSNKITFLRNLINNYKKKGTSEVLANVVSLYGLRNIIISEWWIRYDKRLNEKFYAKSNVVYHPLNLIHHEKFERTLKYDDFISKNPYWHMNRKTLEKKFFDKKTKISLPSITSVISIDSTSNSTNLMALISILQRKILETYDFWLRYTLIPVKFDEQFEKPVYIQILNNPPDISNLNNDFYHYYMVGLNPVGEWANHSRQITRWNPDSEKWEYIYYDNGNWILNDNGTDVIVNNDFPFDILCIKNPSNYFNRRFVRFNYETLQWNVFDTEYRQNRVINVYDNQYEKNNLFTPKKSYTLVDNGTEWINLQSEINNTLFENRNENIFRDIPLNRYSSLYSIFEIMLATAYLLKSSHIIDENTGHYNYNNKLEENYNTHEERTDIDKYRENFEGDGYYPIIQHFKNIIFDQNVLDGLHPEYDKTYRHRYYINNPDNVLGYTQTSPRQERDKKYIEFLQEFIRDNDYSTRYNLYPLLHPEEYIKAVNPLFYQDIQNNIIANDGNKFLVLENMLVDFENYVENIMKIPDTYFAYYATSGQFYNKNMSEVINFFKPFRVHIMDFNVGVEIENPLEDSVLVDGKKVDLTHLISMYEKPFPSSYRHGTEPPDGVWPGEDEYDNEGYLFDQGICTDDVQLTNININVYSPPLSPNDYGYDTELLGYRKPYGDQNFDDHIIKPIYDKILDINIQDVVNVQFYDGGTPGIFEQPEEDLDGFTD